MASQIYYKNVSIGDEMPSLVKHPTPRQLVQWAGATGEFCEMHYNDAFAKEKGFPGIIVHGMLTASFLCQMVNDWMGEEGTIKKLSISNRAMLFPDNDIVCRGQVEDKYEMDGEHFVKCNIWAENPQQDKAVVGPIIVVLPA